MAKKKETKKSDDSKLFAFLAVFLSIIGFIIALVAKKDDKYVMYYAKQSLVLFIIWVIVWVASTILTMITFGLAAVIVYPLVGCVMFIFWIIQIVYSLSGKMKPTPLIGHYAEKIDL